MALKESARNEKTLSAHFHDVRPESCDGELSSFASSFPVRIETQTNASICQRNACETETWTYI